MKTITITKKLAEDILDQLKDVQADCYVQDTQDIIDELNQALRIHDVVGRSEQLPHPDCDEACYYHCTKGETETPPDCLR